MSGEEQHEIATMSSSIYAPLEPGSIRVLQLQPSEQLETLLVATLELLQLTDDANYEALSYAWDGAFNDQELEDGHLSLNGTIVAIKGNLRDALRRLRRSTEVLVLWVDAVCIDQEDLAERSAQVAIMAQIYSSASQVIMWVGEDTPEGDGKAYMGWLRKSAAISRYPSWRRLWRIIPSWLVEQDILRDNCDWIMYQWFNKPVFCWRPGRHISLMRKFTTRRYLTRRWCIQETAFAKRVLVVCGPHELWLSERNDDNTLHDIRPALRLGSERHREDVLEFLAECSLGLQCKDERDYIYALASVLRSRRGCPLITIDYTLPWTQVYVDFTRSLMLANGFSGMYRLLFMAGYQDVSQKWASGLPSWVPDWRFSLSEDTSLRRKDGFDSQSLYNAGTEADSLIACNGEILSIQLACYGDSIAESLPGGYSDDRAYQAGDQLYGPSPEQELNVRGDVNYTHFTKSLLILRPCGGETGEETQPSSATFRIVDVQMGYRPIRPPLRFEGMRNVRIR